MNGLPLFRSFADPSFGGIAHLPFLRSHSGERSLTATHLSLRAAAILFRAAGLMVRSAGVAAEELKTDVVAVPGFQVYRRIFAILAWI
jgi:hypothetical protein